MTPLHFRSSSLDYSWYVELYRRVQKAIRNWRNKLKYTAQFLMNRLETKHGLYTVLLFISCSYACIWNSQMIKNVCLLDQWETQKYEKTTELHPAVLYLAWVTFPHKFLTPCTEEEVLGRAAILRTFVSVVYICREQEQVILFCRPDPSSWVLTAIHPCLTKMFWMCSF